MTTTYVYVMRVSARARSDAALVRATDGGAFQEEREIEMRLDDWLPWVVLLSLIPIGTSWSTVQIDYWLSMVAMAAFGAMQWRS